MADPTPGPLHKAQYEALSEFRYQLRRFLHFSEEAADREGITPLQYQLLLHLQGFPGRSWANIGELAERLQARHNGVVALVSRCELAGLVERRPGRDDRRQVEVHLTPKGESIVYRLAAEHQPELQHLRQEFTLPGWLDATGGA